jgi:hypothetical protein
MYTHAYVCVCVCMSTRTHPPPGCREVTSCLATKTHARGGRGAGVLPARARRGERARIAPTLTHRSCDGANCSPKPHRTVVSQGCLVGEVLPAGEQSNSTGSAEDADDSGALAVQARQCCAVRRSRRTRAETWGGGRFRRSWSYEKSSFFLLLPPFHPPAPPILHAPPHPRQNSPQVRNWSGARPPLGGRADWAVRHLVRNAHSAPAREAKCGGSSCEAVLPGVERRLSLLNLHGNLPRYARQGCAPP